MTAKSSVYRHPGKSYFADCDRDDLGHCLPQHSQGQEPPDQEVASHARKILSALASLPGKTIPPRVKELTTQVKDWAVGKLEARYGKTGARVILKIAALATPIPAPGAGPVALGVSLIVAEAARAYVKMRAPAVAVKGLAEESIPGDLEAAAQEWLQQLEDALREALREGALQGSKALPNEGEEAQEGYEEEKGPLPVSPHKGKKNPKKANRTTFRPGANPRRYVFSTEERKRGYDNAINQSDPSKVAWVWRKVRGHYRKVRREGDKSLGGEGQTPVTPPALLQPPPQPPSQPKTPPEPQPPTVGQEPRAPSLQTPQQPRQQFRMTPKKLEVIRQGRSQATPVTWRELARQIGYTGKEQTLVNLVRRFYPQVPMKKIGRVDKEQLVALAEQGMPRQKIARELNVSKGAVDAVLRKLGLRTLGGTNGATSEAAKQRYQRRAKQEHNPAWLSEISATSNRIKAAKLGWPQANNLAEARILDVLFQQQTGQGLSRGGLAAALGQKPRTEDGRSYLHTHMSKQLHLLLARGLVRIVGHEQGNKNARGQAIKVPIYALAEGVRKRGHGNFARDAYERTQTKKPLPHKSLEEQVTAILQQRGSTTLEQVAEALQQPCDKQGRLPPALFKALGTLRKQGQIQRQGKTLSWLGGGTGGDLVAPPAFSQQEPPQQCPQCGSRNLKALVDEGWRCGDPPCDWGIMSAGGTHKVAVGEKAIVTKKDSLNRTICYEDTTGHRVPCEQEEATPTAPPRQVPEKQPSEKALRAKAAFKLINGTIQRYTEEHNEPQFAAMVNGVSWPDSEPMDVTTSWGDLVELKTLVDNANAKITMDSYSQVRKIMKEREDGVSFHTVVIDDSKVFNAGGPDIHQEEHRIYYYRRGVAGSARIGSLYRCHSREELLTLMRVEEKDLPKGAQRTDGKLRAGRWKFFQDAQGNGYKDKKTNRVVRAKK